MENVTERCVPPAPLLPHTAFRGFSYGIAPVGGMGRAPLCPAAEKGAPAAGAETTHAPTFVAELDVEQAVDAVDGVLANAGQGVRAARGEERDQDAEVVEGDDGL